MNQQYGPNHVTKTIVELPELHATKRRVIELEQEVKWLKEELRKYKRDSKQDKIAVLERRVEYLRRELSKHEEPETTIMKWLYAALIGDHILGYQPTPQEPEQQAEPS